LRDLTVVERKLARKNNLGNIFAKESERIPQEEIEDFLSQIPEELCERSPMDIGRISSAIPTEIIDKTKSLLI
jgi:hypothetical protein